VTLLKRIAKLEQRKPSKYEPPVILFRDADESEESIARRIQSTQFSNVLVVSFVKPNSNARSVADKTTVS
jgi:5S rRNA maturation endonuclease (ribonuclease M5)